MSDDLSRLPQSDIEEAVRAVSRAPRAPWYVEVFLAIGGWVAGLLAAGAIFSFAAAVLPDKSSGEAFAGLALLVGVGFALTGTMLGRRKRRDFARHFAIAAIAAGLTAAIGGFWYLVSSMLEHFGVGAARHDMLRVGYAGIIVSLAAAAVSTPIARMVKDGILSFLTTLAVFAIVIFSASTLNAEHAIAPSLYWLFAPVSAFAGLILFTRPIRREVFTAAGAALMIGPMLYFDGLRNYAQFLGVAPPTRFAGYAGEAVFVAGVLYCLSALRGRYPFYGLISAAVLLFAGILLLPNAGDVAILILLAGFTANHRGLAAIGTVALAWFIARFYYDLSLTLLQKSAIMASLGAATLAGVAVFQRLSGAWRGAAEGNAAAAAPGDRRPLALTLAFAVIVAGASGLISHSAMRLENEFREARAILLPLGPSDPRSLIQGDYMTLIFRESIYPPFEEAAALPDSGQIFLALDADNVASFSRIAGPGDAPGPEEILVDYARDAFGAIQYCPASFFFQEGDAAVYARARFAVVLVAPSGRTRLVDLADEDHKVINPDTDVSSLGAEE